MPKRVATEGVADEQYEVRYQNESTEPHPKPSVEPECIPYVTRKNDEKHEGQIEKIAVDILHDQRKRAFAEVSFSRLANAAGRWVRPKRLVICPAVVVAR